MKYDPNVAKNYADRFGEDGIDTYLTLGSKTTLRELRQASDDLRNLRRNRPRSRTIREAQNPEEMIDLINKYPQLLDLAERRIAALKEEMELWDALRLFRKESY